MKIALFTSERKIEFSLPNQIFGSLSFDEKEEETAKLINIDASNNVWNLVSTVNVKVLNNGVYTQSAVLMTNNYYILERDNIKYLIYVFENYDCTFVTYKYNQKINITVGKGKDCSINYNDNSISDLCFTIKSDNNRYILKNLNNNYLYINKKRVIDKETILLFGDIIELLGLKIVFLNGLVLINNPSNKLFVNKLISGLDEFIIDLGNNFQNSEIRENDLYNDKDYFSKSPRIRRTISTKVLKIDGPPSKGEEEEIPLIYTLGPMVTMGITSSVSLINGFMKISSGETTFSSSWTTMIPSIAMLVSTALWPNLTKAYNKRQKRKKEKNAVNKYHKYLELKKKEIADEAKIQSDILKENLLSNNECFNIIINKKVGLWSRRIEQEDFLTVRIGIGDYPLDITINCPEEGFSVDDLPLKKEAQNISKEYDLLRNVPIRYSLLNRTITAIMGNKSKVNTLVKNIILQLVTFHSYEDLKIIIFTNNKEEWNFIKYYPHNFDNSKQFRFFGCNIEDIKEISNYLEQEINYRRYDENMNDVNREYTSFKPYYLIITDNYSKIRKINFMKIITEINNNYGFSLILIENKLSKLPSKCSNFISIGDSSSQVLENAYEEQKVINFNDEIDYGIDMNLVGKIISNIPIEFERGPKSLPTSISFLEMENVGKVEQLNIINRWKNNDPIKSLKAEVGIDENGDLMYLDLHEKFHGPHGLIAGMTGSGKSEFIITYVLSMAINYSPYEVSFVLIDYKGGSLAGAFENRNVGIKLPHLAGTITNLDKAEMDRTLVSIDSEVRRRQKIFNNAKDKLGESTIDIYKYQQFYRDGKLDEPIPHLIIICDEFAELKSQQPDFMDNLISIARIGRSLGIHLVLATQKPSGVVDDQIWSNSKFRVCLKVQEKADSMEMLKRPEAAELKQVGRYYLQVGYNELFQLGQSAWCGAKYFPSDKVKKNVDKSVDFINNTGYIIKSMQGASNKGPAKGEEIAAIMKHIMEAAQRENIFSQRLWLDNVPNLIYIDDLINKYSNNIPKDDIYAIIGEYDDPNNQSQGLLKINLNKDGNTIIYGNEGSDKEMFIDAMIYSTITRYTSSDINYYIIDYGSESLRKFSSFPHIGDIVYLDEDEKLLNLLKLINHKLSERKQLFSSFGGEYNNYIKVTENKIPLIGIIINNYDAFEEANPNLDDEIIKITRDGLRYGLFFVFTANSDGSIRRKIKQNFNSIFALKLNDISEYSTIFNRVNTIPKEIPGRGIFKMEDIYEFQTALINDNPSQYLNSIIETIKNSNSLIAEHIPTLPKLITIDYVSKYLKNLTCIPIGISKKTLEIITYDFTSYLSTFIFSTTSINTANFSRTIINELLRLNDIQIIVIDINKEIPEVSNIIKYYYDNNPDKIIDILIHFLRQVKTNSIGFRTIIYFQNFYKFKLKININKLDEFTNELKSIETVNLIIADDYKKIKKSEFDTWYRNIQNDTDGIWIGTGLSDQNMFKLSKLSKEMERTYQNNFGFIIKDGRAELIKTIELSEFKEGDIIEQ